MAWLAVYLSAVVTIVTMLKASGSTFLCQCCHQCCGSYCGKVLLCLMLLTVCSYTNCEIKDRRNCRRGTITPRDPYFLEGEEINLICNRRRGRSKHLTFVWGRHSEIVNEAYITRINETAIQLKTPNITSEDIDATGYNVQYRCVHKKNHSKCFDNVYVQLEYALREPVNLQCRDYNFNEMKCTWSHSVDYHVPSVMNVTCDYRTDGTEFKYKTFGRHWMTCQNLTNDSCYWDASDYPAPESYIDVRVSITDSIRNVTKTITKTFNKYDIIVPGPVTRLRIHFNSTKPRCVQLQWTPPITTRSFEFNVTYVSNCSNQQERRIFYFEENSTFGDDIEICDLVPKTEYKFSVKGRVFKKGESGKFEGYGHWSEPTSINVMTKEDVPDENPVISPGLYELSHTIGPQSEESSVSFQLYWDLLKECHLHDLPENVVYQMTVNNRSTTVSHPDFKAEINVPEQNVFNVTLEAINSVGSPTLSRTYTVYKYSLHGPKPSELIIQYNKTGSDCVTYAEIEVREKSPEFTHIHHTLVWCEGTNVCTKTLQKKVLENETSFILPGNLCNANHRYGLVTHGYLKHQGLNVSSGIQWESCIYQSGKELDEYLHVKVVSQHSNGLEVEWTRYNCKTTYAYVLKYMVTYCKNNDEDECNCVDDKKDINVSRETSTYSATELEAGFRYCVLVSGFSKTGQGPASSSSVMVGESDDKKASLIIGAVCVVLAASGLIGLVIYCCRKYSQKMKENVRVKIPEFESDEANMIPKTLNNIAESSSHYTNNTSAGTEMTNLEEHHLLIDAEDNIDGYKDPNDVDVVESGYHEGSISEHCSNISHGIRSSDFREESHLSSDKVVTNESQGNHGKSAIGINSSFEHDKLSVSNCTDVIMKEGNTDCVEMNILSNQDMSLSEFNLKQSDDEISLNKLIEQDEQSDGIYKEFHSGSTILDESDKEQSETELSEDISHPDNVIENTASKINAESNVAINTVLSDSCGVKMSDINQSGPSTPCAITDCSDYEQSYSDEKTLSNFDKKYHDSDTDSESVDSLNGLVNEKSEPGIEGYKQTEDVEEPCDCDVESDSEEDSETEASTGYKRSDDVCGMNASDEEEGSKSNVTDTDELPEKFAKQDGVLQSKNGFIKHDTKRNEIVKNGLLHKFSDTIKAKSNSLSGSDNSITSTTGSSHGNCSSADSYVKAGEVSHSKDSKEELEKERLKENFKVAHKKNGVKVPENVKCLVPT